jgi:hypothetical protein
MKNNSLTPMGSLHPILFFAGIYIVALVLSVFICSSLFYSCNARSAKLGSTEAAPVEKQLNQSGVVAIR